MDPELYELGAKQADAFYQAPVTSIRYLLLLNGVLSEADRRLLGRDGLLARLTGKVDPLPFRSALERLAPESLPGQVGPVTVLLIP